MVKKRNIVATIEFAPDHKLIVYLPSGRSIVLGDNEYHDGTGVEYISLKNLFCDFGYLDLLLSRASDTIKTKGDIWPELVANRDKIRDPKWVNAFLYKHYVNKVISDQLDDDLRTEPW